MTGQQVKADASSLQKLLTFGAGLLGYVWPSEFIQLLQEVEQWSAQPLDNLGKAIGTGELFAKIKAVIDSYKN